MHPNNLYSGTDSKSLMFGNVPGKIKQSAVNISLSIKSYIFPTTVFRNGIKTPFANSKIKINFKIVFRIQTNIYSDKENI